MEHQGDEQDDNTQMGSGQTEVKKRELLTMYMTPRTLLEVMMMMMMFIGTETLVTQLVCEISRMQAC